MKTHNSSRIIFSGRTLAIKTVTVYTVKSNAKHTFFGMLFILFQVLSDYSADWNAPIRTNDYFTVRKAAKRNTESTKSLQGKHQIASRKAVARNKESIQYYEL